MVVIYGNYFRRRVGKKISSDTIRSIVQFWKRVKVKTLLKFSNRHIRKNIKELKNKNVNLLKKSHTAVLLLFNTVISEQFYRKMIVLFIKIIL
jgi:hypothetical protein